MISSENQQSEKTRKIVKFKPKMSKTETRDDIDSSQFKICSINENLIGGSFSKKSSSYRPKPANLKNFSNKNQDLNKLNVNPNKKSIISPLSKYNLLEMYKNSHQTSMEEKIASEEQGHQNELKNPLKPAKIDYSRSKTDCLESDVNTIMLVSPRGVGTLSQKNPFPAASPPTKTLKESFMSSKKGLTQLESDVPFSSFKTDSGEKTLSSMSILNSVKRYQSREPKFIESHAPTTKKSKNPINVKISVSRPSGCHGNGLREHAGDAGEDFLAVIHKDFDIEKKQKKFPKFIQGQEASFLDKVERRIRKDVSLQPILPKVSAVSGLTPILASETSLSEEIINNDFLVGPANLRSANL